ncbi:hypothetical protein FHW02_003773 [Ochrobactrum sp. RH1CCR137]|nr:MULTISPECIES: hypothetical protein [unclassified Ochrobactrum]MBA8845691.1 hypothetical protein [Ochrobactrum sp. RH1CCR137]MBA8857413.1 hypothetical protein [Ochrobactrum sp. RH1CCR134]
MTRNAKDQRGAEYFTRALRLPEKPRQLVEAGQAYQATRNARALASRELSDMRLSRSNAEAGVTVRSIPSQVQIDDAADNLAELVNQDTETSGTFNALNREYVQSANQELQPVYAAYAVAVLEAVERLDILLKAGEDFHREALRAGLSPDHPAINGSKATRGLIDNSLKLARSWCR